MRTLRVGTRGSRLARAQTQEAVQAIEAVGVRVEVVVCRTLGDQQPEARLASIAGPGVFARAIEEALLDGRIDVAVHSAKDVGIAPLEGTELVAYLPRADVRDVLVSRSGSPLTGLPVWRARWHEQSAARGPAPLPAPGCRDSEHSGQRRHPYREGPARRLRWHCAGSRRSRSARALGCSERILADRSHASRAGPGRGCAAGAARRA